MQTKMARKGEKCKKKLISDFQNGRRRPFWEKKWKLRFHLKWREMQTKMNFGHPKWPPAAILWKKMKVAFWSEMARNANKSEFQTSKMATGGHFEKRMNHLSTIFEGAGHLIYDSILFYMFQDLCNKIVLDLAWKWCRFVFGHDWFFWNVVCRSMG